MNIPLNAQVDCTDGVCGHSVCVLINPVTDQVTHLVVKEDAIPYAERIVPVDVLADTQSDTVQLHCSKAEFQKMNTFIKTTFIEEKMPVSALGYGGGTSVMGTSFYLPYVTPEIMTQVPVENLEIPGGELAVTRGTRVEATDGYVGKVDEFVVNPENGVITHLVMREGHLWGKKEVTIPLTAMGETREDTVFLKLDKSQIESLPTFPLKRRWS